MAKFIKTYLFCLDDHRSFAEDVKKRFADQSKYIVSVFHNSADLIKNLNREKEHNHCKVAILGVQDSKENMETIDHLTVEIKKIDRRTGIILLGPHEKMEDIRKEIRTNIDSYIPQNANKILRIHNTVKKLISEHSLLKYRRRMKFSLYFFLIFMGIAILLAIIAYFKFPVYF
jgi:DNA-binding NarL/FixJ family response regulator